MDEEQCAVTVILEPVHQYKSPHTHHSLFLTQMLLSGISSCFYIVVFLTHLADFHIKSTPGKAAGRLISAILSPAPLCFSSSISSPSAHRGRDVCFVMATTQKSLWWTPPALRSCTRWCPRSLLTGSAPWASSDPAEPKVRHTAGKEEEIKQMGFVSGGEVGLTCAGQCL